MADFNLIRQLRCPECRARSTCGPEQTLGHLRRAGMLRREAQPDWAVLMELMDHHSSSLSCAECGHTGLVLEELTDDFDDFDGRVCEDCGQLIALERIEIFPDVTRCTACAERPQAEEADYCPQCGAIMTVRARNGAGISRYVSACSDCGYKA